MATLLSGRKKTFLIALSFLTHTMTLIRFFITLVFLSFFSLVQAQEDDAGAQAQQKELAKLAWQKGPSEGKIAGKASIKVPDGYVFLGERDSSRFLQLMGNPPGKGYYLLAPESLGWFSVFSFDAEGYVKDNEKIDADDLLKSLKSSDEASNEQRKKLGMETLYTDGWQVLPHYNTEAKRLEWGLRLKTGSGETSINYTARLLGRTGVMSATLVSSPEDLAADTKEFQAALTSFDYNSGEKYAEFKEGDKIAEYGLAALVLGGAAAVATKKGFWGALIAFIVAAKKLAIGAVIAAFVGIKAFFSRKKS